VEKVTEDNARSGVDPMTFTSADALTFPDEAVTFVVPGERDVNSPEVSTVPTFSLLLDQVKAKSDVTIQVALLRLPNFSSFRGKIGYKMNHFLP
jgi:hypothetical protein